MMRSFIGIDIGTTISKGVVITECGDLVCEHQMCHSYANELDYSDYWWNEISIILMELIRNMGKGYELFSITISAMAPNLIMLDDKGNVVNKTVLFTDDFAIVKQEELDNKDGTKWKNETLSKLIVLSEAENWNSVRKVLTTHNYIGYKLTGTMCCDIATAYEYGNVFDESLGSWNDAILHKHNLSSSILPEIVAPTTIIGKVKKEIADQFGISYEVNVIAGSHDSIASMLGAGLSQKDDHLIYYGTFNCSATIHENVSDILIGKTLISPVEWTSSIPDSGPQFTAMCKLMTGDEDYCKFDKMAQNSRPGANGVIFIQNPQLLKTSISSKSNGCFWNLTNKTSREDMCRAIYESFPYGILSFWESIADFKYPKECYVAGGGTRSLARMQIVSDVLGITQYKLNYAENAVGTALIGIASYDMSLFFNLQQKRKNDAKVIKGAAENSHEYEVAASQYRKLLKNLEN